MVSCCSLACCLWICKRVTSTDGLLFLLLSHCFDDVANFRPRVYITISYGDLILVVGYLIYAHILLLHSY